MLLSKSCVYGIRSMIYLTMKQENNFVQIKNISGDLGISFHFLTKILQVLTQGGLVYSFKGPKGGVKLAKPAENIFLFDIVTIIDGADLFEQCILGLPGCNQQKPCPLHDDWDRQRESIKDNFKRTSLAQMADKINKKNLRLADNG